MLLYYVRMRQLLSFRRFLFLPEIILVCVWMILIVLIPQVRIVVGGLKCDMSADSLTTHKTLINTKYSSWRPWRSTAAGTAPWGSGLRHR